MNLGTITIKALLFGVDYIQEPISQKLIPLLQRFIYLKPDDISKGISALFWLLKTTIESNKDAIFSGIFLIIGTPFFSFISSKTEEFATGKSYPFKWSIFFNEIKRGLSLSFRNSLKQLGLIFNHNAFRLYSTNQYYYTIAHISCAGLLQWHFNDRLYIRKTRL